VSPLPVVVLTGQLAAGKSTVARAVLDRFPLGYLVDVDAVREQVTSGLAGPLGWTEETSRQFRLAVEGAAALAAVYQPAGFAVAVEGAVDPVEVDLALEAVGLLGRRVGVVLQPPPDACSTSSGRTKNRTSDPLEGVRRPPLRRGPGVASSGCRTGTPRRCRRGWRRT